MLDKHIRSGDLHLRCICHTGYSGAESERNGEREKDRCFDDLELPPIEGVTIWILRHAEQQMGRICAQKLLNLIAGKPEASCRLPWRYREEDE